MKCHGAERPRGNLRMGNLQAMSKGGDDGKVITLGKSHESPLVIAGAQADANHDHKLNQSEMVSVADLWFDKLDTDKAGKLSQEQFAKRENVGARVRG